MSADRLARLNRTGSGSLRDGEQIHPRTSHAEASATLYVGSLEDLCEQSHHRHHVDDDHPGSRRIQGPNSRGSSSKAVGPSPDVVSTPTLPRWVTPPVPDTSPVKP